METEEFELILIENEIDYVFEKDVLIINGYVDLSYNNLTSLPNNIIFNGDVNLSCNNLTSLPKNIVFNTNVYLRYNNLTSLPNNIIFNEFVDLSNNNLTSLPDNIIFNGDVYLRYNKFNVPTAGKYNREIIIFNCKSEAQIRLGCWQGNEADTLKRIVNDYGKNSDYYKIVKKEFDNFNNKGTLWK